MVRFQKFGLLGQITFTLPGETENFAKSVKDYMKIGKISGDFEKNTGKASSMYLHIRGMILRNFEQMLKDLVFYLTLLKEKKISKIAMKFFHSFFKISWSLLYHFFKVFQNFFISAAMFPQN